MTFWTKELLSQKPDSEARTRDDDRSVSLGVFFRHYRSTIDSIKRAGVPSSVGFGVRQI